MAVKISDIKTTNENIEIVNLRLPTEEECESFVRNESIINQTGQGFCCFFEVEDWEDDESEDWDDIPSVDWGDSFYDVPAVLLVPIAESKNVLSEGDIYILNGVPFVAKGEHTLVCKLFINFIYDYVGFTSYEEYRNTMDEMLEEFMDKLN